MKRLAAVSVLLAIIILGCGTDQGTAPVIMNMHHEVTYALVGFGNGVLSIIGTVDFVDPDGDIAYMHVAERECGAGPERSLDKRILDMQGRTSGTILFVALVATNCPVGSYAAVLTVVDGQGNESNPLPVAYKLVSPTQQ